MFIMPVAAADTCAVMALDSCMSDDVSQQEVIISKCGKFADFFSAIIR